MSYYEEFIDALKTKEVKEYGKDFFKTLIKTLRGDSESLLELVKIVGSGPVFYKNITLVQKMRKFMIGVCLDEEDYKYLAEVITNDDQEVNAERILDCLDSIETKEKVVYVINATRSHLRYLRGMQGLNANQYFRMLHIIKNIILEDITFLTQKIKVHEVVDSEECVALEHLGLMYITTSDNGVHYAFSPLSYIFYREIIKSDNDNLPCVREPREFPTKMDMGLKIVEF